LRHSLSPSHDQEDKQKIRFVKEQETRQRAEQIGQGGEIEAQIAAILFEHTIQSVDFPYEALTCLPKVSWKIPIEELIHNSTKICWQRTVH
jgi:hypothetical protein